MKAACPKCKSENTEDYLSPGAVVRPIGSNEPYPVSIKMLRCLDCNETAELPNI